MRLNLERRDRALSALLAGFRVLERHAEALEDVESLSALARRRLRTALAEAIALLNDEGYDEVQQLLGEIRSFAVDEPLLRRVFAQVRGEPALADQSVAPLRLQGQDALPCPILVPQKAFEDILTNLLRNALQASLRREADATQGPVEIGLGVERAVDPITGIERVIFRVRDRATEELTTAVLRSQYVEQGLGLSADLVARYDGFLDVATEEVGWSKAVVLGLPSAELAEVGP